MPKSRKFAQWENCSMRTDGQARMTMLIVAFRNFANAPKNTIVLANISLSIYVCTIFSVLFVFSWRLTPATITAVRLLHSVAPAPFWTATKAHLRHLSRNDAPNTWRLHTLLATHSSQREHLCWSQGTSVLLWSLMGIFGEQPTAVTCNYERLAERSQTHGSDGPAFFLGWLSLKSNKLTTYLFMFRRLHWGGVKYDVTHLNNSQSRHQGCTYTARHVAGASELCTVAPNIGGSCVRNLVHVTHLTPGRLRWLLHAWKICAPLVYPWQKVRWAGSFDSISRPPGCMTRNFLCITVSIPSGAHAGWNANSIIIILRRLRYKCIFRRGGYTRCKFLY